ncbi:MAG: type I-B CRISPR-associated protein Cas7/Cst2/DevR [Candidatus Coatesbacteria bacterium]|nr:MAG: type I-B CRISPR-associated protein Cas7/Cst2/DevR [Candidatus Coatesbacteria bacterium]
MRKIVIGILTHISGNVNANEVEGDRIRIKKLVSSSGETYPFVSARAVKRGIREKLREFGFDVDPFRIGEGDKLADSGDPIKYVDNDLFGYLYIKGNQQKARISPVSMSPIVAVEHTPIQIDFGGSFPRELNEDVNPTPFEIEVADLIGLMKVVITERCGMFIESERTDQLKKWEEYVKEGKIEKTEKGYELNKNERINRIKAILEILLNEGWAYPRRANFFAMAEHVSAIAYCGEKLYPIWKNMDIENNTFIIPDLRKDDSKKLLKVYNLKSSNIPNEEIERMAEWLVNGKWRGD